ncbi:glycosyltransferase [Bradyrhizobium sp. Gha]|uniref:glycosyltransferase family protein n=1 Tax=Bradyrhizobium sp. Gha TaxID=1855318 RepID=UPI0008ED92B9|nr:glycosyltransferase [Bradyrhizobium sp. Gha]SFI49319.1 Glycosyl transferases group 1 [Bradyrhizobium sp. Gha]
MRIFQNNGLSRGFRSYRTRPRRNTFRQQILDFLGTRFAALHILSPVLDGDARAFYTNGDDQRLQTAWAVEQGLQTSNLTKILLAQIEHHNTEVFYNLDPMLYASDFVKRLPGCVRHTICWRAAPSGNVDLSEYDLVVCNFPSILQDWERKGCRVAYFAPAYDPSMSEYAGRTTKPLDLIFAGGFSRHHIARSAILGVAAGLQGVQSSFHLEQGRLTRVANAFPFIPLLSNFAYPRQVAERALKPLYGREMYSAFASAKIVLNGAVDMAGADRGNMRCFEATGCGSVLLTDAGNYPEGFVDGETMLTYSAPSEIASLVHRLLADPSWASSIGEAGHRMVKSLYSKARQWNRFKELVG